MQFDVPEVYLAQQPDPAPLMADYLPAAEGGPVRPARPDGRRRPSLHR
jgi:hypothetical protein